MEVKDYLDLTAEQEKLLPSYCQLGEITSSLNDYPDSRNESGKSDHCLLGFDTLADAETFADSIGSEVCLFTKRDGHHFWHNAGNMVRALTPDDYVKDLGENYNICDENLVCESIKDVIDSFEGKELIAYLRAQVELLEEIEKAGKGQTVICSNGFNYYDTVPDEMMSYHEDVTTYSIGVIIRYQEEEE